MNEGSEYLGAKEMKEEGLCILGFLVAEGWQREGRGQHAGFSVPCVQGRETVIGGLCRDRGGYYDWEAGYTEEIRKWRKTQIYGG